MHHFTVSLAERGSEERRTTTHGVIACAFLILSPSKRDATLLRAFLLVFISKYYDATLSNTREDKQPQVNINYFFSEKRITKTTITNLHVQYRCNIKLYMYNI